MVCNAFDDPESALESGRKLAHPEPGEEIVISGTAGIFPDSDHPEIPHRTGKLLDISHFDAAFFGIHYKQAHTMDPMCRLLLEKTYETVIDAGYNPRSLYGSRIGVFIGACFSESEKTWLYEKLQVNGFGITGCSRAMLANRVSYWLGVDGPSYTVDSACSSSMYALEHGYRAIRDGECDAAIVGGCNLCLHPHVSLQFARLGVLSMDGRCKSFDEAANGYCRSEAISVMFLQKKKDARRIYATLVHAKTNCDGYKEQGITFPSGPQQQVLLRDFYNECQIDPSTLAWVEAHGTGTKVGDPEEVKALENIFCEGREKPLKIGSVKSNIGHSEPASGVCSISKVIIAMETGFIPPNINFTKPKSDIEAFHNGKITVITEKTPWEGGLVGVNSFGFGGANGHVLLKWNEKGKVNGGMPKDDLPRLVGVSGRTEEAVDYILTYIGLISLLKTVGLSPDRYFGTSFGEIACAYLDGALTAEEAILTAYHMGVVFQQQEDGSMALIGSPVDFVVMVQKVSGNFEVVEGDVAVVTGRIYVPDDIEKETSGLDITPPNDEELILSPKDIYKEFRLRGYNYKGLFRGLAKADEAGVNGRIQWRNNWVPFMDNMLQMILLSGDTRGLFVPTYIERVVIDPKKHTNIVNSLPDDTVPVYANKEMELIISGGVEVRNLQCTVIQRRKPLGEPVIEKHVFTPYSSTKQECVQGLEYSGIDKSGRRVMGMTSNGGLASIVVADKPLMWRIPDEWTLEEAATVPVVYGTVTYALLKFGRLTRGETILIHAGSGGVGLAAIHLAYFYGLDIFTTVGTKEKREFLKKQFPQLTDNRIGNSRDTSFEQLIMKETNGRGVDIVLNSLSEEKLLASVRCLAPGGRFLEIGKFDLANNNQLARPEEKMKFTHLLDDALEAGAIVPLPRTTFQSDEIEQAFRYMATGKHAGKILVKIRDLPSNILKPDLLLIPAIPRFYCDPNKSYIIVGGMGGFGLELADWLVLRGAKNLILSSRTGLKNGYQSYRIKIWKAYGVRVCISTWDITTNNGVQALLKDASSFGPVGGIFNLAVVLRDALLENQTESDFKISLAPKATATHYFDIYSRTMCPQLEQFVVFSSVSCGRGNMGQTNYGMANSIMERICEARAADGLPALAVQWGAVGDVGLVAEMQEENTEIIIGGTLQQQISSCLQVLDLFMNQKQPVVSSMVVAEKRVGAGSSESIVDTVANILGLRDLKTVSLHSTLAELGMDSMMAVEIKQTLEREFEVFLTPQDIRSMTFSKLHEYSVTDKSINTNKPSGNNI
ncbi:hypothetical protein AAG570_008106 [Ranatra chinensis]|uniref:Fatty acid synthase n=1 Tax=Ranatra chinensis TaxID=642074 RepID=A0ABD0Y921_9HEMI